jgi:hypothetical protein
VHVYVIYKGIRIYKHIIVYSYKCFRILLIRISAGGTLAQIDDRDIFSSRSNSPSRNLRGNPIDIKHAGVNKDGRISPYYSEDVYDSMFNRTAHNEADVLSSATVAGIMVPIQQGKKKPKGSNKNSNLLVITGEIRKIRQAEMVLLKEEERCGKYSLDADGRLVPIVVAKTRRLAAELCKDDRRSVEYAAHTASTHAPHAIPSGIGILDEEELLAIEEKKNSTQIKGDMEGDNGKIDVLKQTDFDSNPRMRGQDKVGGMLAPIETKVYMSIYIWIRPYIDNFILRPL